MQTLKAATQRKRCSQGAVTHLQDSVSGQHETNGIAETMVQTVRHQALCHVQMLREKAGIGVGHQEPIFAWAFRHAGWCLNRYHVRSSTGMTLFSVCHRNTVPGKAGRIWRNSSLPCGALCRHPHPQEWRCSMVQRNLSWKDREQLVLSLTGLGFRGFRV